MLGFKLIHISKMAPVLLLETDWLLLCIVNYIFVIIIFDTSKPRHNDQHYADGIFKLIFLCEHG